MSTMMSRVLVSTGSLRSVGEPYADIQCDSPPSPRLCCSGHGALSLS
jgi:hypothetical protein